jgi:excisionase family DNA binding protein
MTPDELLADGCLDVAGSAEFLCCGRTFLYAEMDAGRLQYIKLGRRRLIPRRELVRFAAAAIRGGWNIEAEFEAGQLERCERNGNKACSRTGRTRRGDSTSGNRLAAEDGTATN